MALPNNTFASPGVPFYALAGESAKNWYKFPSVNGQVLLQDASGTQVLQAIGGDLFFNQELLAKANDIQDIADYSLYPVINPAGVNFDGNPLVGASTITASGEINGGSLVVSGGINTLTSSISTSGISTNDTIPGVNQIVTGSVVAETIQATTGAVLKGASLNDALDMINNPINRASAINLNNSGFGPYGSLTSPNGTQLLWNGATVSTGAAGNVSQWANFPAVAPIQGNGQPLSNVTTISATGNITTTGSYVGAPNLQSDNLVQLGNPVVNNPLKVEAQNASGLLLNSLAGGIASVAQAGKIESTATGDVNLTTSGGDVNVLAYNNVNVNSGNDVNITADGGLNPLLLSAVNINAKNGGGGQVYIKADPAALTPVPGAVYITANGGTINIPNPPPAPPTPVTVGGLISLDANAGFGVYTASSAVKISAGGVNIYAGALPSVGSLAGYLFQYGMGGVSICAGLPSSGFQIPFTTYIYGVGVPGVAGGVRIQSPTGIQMLSDTYIENLYPLDGNGLTIQGRSLPTGYVTIKDVTAFTMRGGSALQTDNLSSVSGAGILYGDNLIPLNNSKGIYTNFIKPIQATAPGVPNLVISNNPFLANTNYVEITGADVIAFDATGAGSLTGVKSINGAVWPPPTGDASLWSQYFATSTIDASNNGIINLSTINGQPVGDLTPAGWAAFSAIQSVDMSSNSLNNVGGINTVAGAAIISAGALSIFSDASGDLSLASNGGGNVNIGTGNAGDINIATSGAGNEVTVAGDIVNLQGTQGVRVDAPVLDLAANNIYNVATLRGSLGTDLAVIAEGAGNLNMEGTNITATAIGNANLNSTSGSIISTASVNNEITATNGAVNITANTQIDLTAPVINFNANVNANGTFNASSVAATGDVVSSSGSTPYSLNTIGALVNGNQQYDYWVAVNGSNTTGTGSAIRPFATVTGALAATLSISDAIPINIRITAGTYTENPTVTRNNTFLVGNVGVADAVIIGTITFDPTATATVSQGMSGVTVVGNVVCNDAITFDINWYFQYCNVTSYTAAAINAFSTGSGNNSLFINNTVVTQNVTANTAVTLNSVRLNAIQCQLNNTTTGACISANGTASMSLFGCTLTSAGAATASALITYINAVSNGTASSFNLNTFTYTAGTAGSAKAAFFFNNAGALAGSTIINNNVFNLPGAAALIQRPGAGSIAIAFGANTTSIQTIPASGAGFTFTYTASTPLSATALYDQLGSAGTNQQVLGAGAGGQLQWRSLTNTSLGAIPQAAAASVYQNQPLYFNTTTNAINYIAVADDVIVQPCPATLSPIPSNKGTTYILTSAAGGSTFTFNNNAGSPLTANDAGWYLYIKNGNGTLGGDITINGVLVSGNTVVHNQTATMNGGIVIVRWTGTAFVVY
jgi:hypothetical protein